MTLTHVRSCEDMKACLLWDPFWIPALMTLTHHHLTLSGVRVIQLQQEKGYPHMHIAWAWRHAWALLLP